MRATAMGLFQPRDPFRELRKSPRFEIHSLALIDLGSTSAPISCIISDISASGAKLTITGEQELPEQFTLLLRRRCKVVRRFDGQLGVEFVRA
jgi:hypothetical protein